VVSDVDAMENSVLRGLSSLVDEMFTFLIVASIVVTLQPVVGLCTLVPLIFSFLIIRTFGQRVKKVYELARDRLGDIGVFVHDRLAGVQVTQAFNQRETELKNFSIATEAHYRQSILASKLRALFFPAVGAFGFCSSLVMLGMGAWFIWRGQFTLGGLLAYRGYWWRLQSPINTIARTSDIIFRARAAGQRVVQILREPITITDAPSAVPWQERLGDIEFRNVSFQYTPQRPILRHVSFRIAPGEFVAIAGRSGSGKTTLLNLIPRFYQPDSGAVLIDGLSAADYTLDSLRGGIGMVLQETYLFNDTVFENIRYALPGADRGSVEQAARAANAHEFIVQLSLGYETVVGERGVKLSGGQKQRLSLARALLSNPAILLLDEPTSAVEPESEELIHRALLELSGERTTVLVTHRLTLLRRASQILFVQDGTILARGPHSALLANCEEYAEAFTRWESEEMKQPLAT
jgi:ATP-binding cassette subfamily B protein